MPRRPDVQYIQYGINGSLACQPEPVRKPRTKLPPKPAKRKRRNIYIDPLAIGGIALATVMLALMLVGVARLRQAEERTERLRAQVETLREENVTLRASFVEQVDRELIREQAESLGLVPVDQVEHITVKAPRAEQQEESGGWDRFYSFLAGLFA